MDKLHKDYDRASQSLVDVLDVVSLLQRSLGPDKVGIIPGDPTTVSSYVHGQAPFFRPEDAGIVITKTSEESRQATLPEEGATES